MINTIFDYHYSRAIQNMACYFSRPGFTSYDWSRNNLVIGGPLNHHNNSYINFLCPADIFCFSFVQVVLTKALKKLWEINQDRVFSSLKGSLHAKAAFHWAQTAFLQKIKERKNACLWCGWSLSLLWESWQTSGILINLISIVRWATILS